MARGFNVNNIELGLMSRGLNKRRRANVVEGVWLERHPWLLRGVLLVHPWKGYMVGLMR